MQRALMPRRSPTTAHLSPSAGDTARKLTPYLFLAPALFFYGVFLVDPMLFIALYQLLRMGRAFG